MKIHHNVPATTISAVAMSGGVDMVFPASVRTWKSVIPDFPATEIGRGKKRCGDETTESSCGVSKGKIGISVGGIAREDETWSSSSLVACLSASARGELMTLIAESEDIVL